MNSFIYSFYSVLNRQEEKFLMSIINVFFNRQELAVWFFLVRM